MELIEKLVTDIRDCRAAEGQLHRLSRKPAAMSRHPPSKLFLSDAGAKLIMDREGCELTAYHDSRGILTVGCGHTSDAGPPAVKEGMTITEEEAMQIFREDCRALSQRVPRAGDGPPHAYEFDALAQSDLQPGHDPVRRLRPRWRVLTHRATSWGRRRRSFEWTKAA